MQLNSDMVVLNACETGLGEQISGEGVIGLAWAFFFTGVKSVVASLWSVNDAYTADFMVEFYKNIKAGKTKSESLRNAKLKFLDNKLTADPFFWAPFVSYGVDDPLYFPEEKRKKKIVIGLSSAGVVAIILAFWWRRRQTRTLSQAA